MAEERIDKSTPRGRYQADESFERNIKNMHRSGINGTFGGQHSRYGGTAAGLLILQLRAILRQFPGLNPTRRVNTRAKWL